jgi:hypothetical protein
LMNQFRPEFTDMNQAQKWVQNMSYKHFVVLTNLKKLSMYVCMHG